MEQKHIDNLNTLADFLANNSKKIAHQFDMDRFIELGDYDQHEHHANYNEPVNAAEILNKCGTSACAMGWAATIFEAEIKEHNVSSYVDLSKVLFDIDSSLDGQEYIWQFLFSQDWAHLDNTPEYAAFRIKYFLDNPTLDAIEWSTDAEYRPDYENDLYAIHQIIYPVFQAA